MYLSRIAKNYGPSCILAGAHTNRSSSFISKQFNAVYMQFYGLIALNKWARTLHWILNCIKIRRISIPKKCKKKSAKEH